MSGKSPTSRKSEKKGKQADNAANEKAKEQKENLNAKKIKPASTSKQEGSDNKKNTQKSQKKKDEEQTNEKLICNSNSLENYQNKLARMKSQDRLFVVMFILLFIATIVGRYIYNEMTYSKFT